MDSDRRLRHVLTELDRYAGEIKRSAISSYILCPFHSERTPSGQIQHDPRSKWPGSFKCFGCGKRAKWDELAPLIGLKPIKWSKPEEQFALKAVRFKRADKTEEREIRLTDIPPDKVWRKIPTNLLIKIGCRKGRFHYPDKGVDGHAWVYMPVLVHGELMGYTRARMKKEKDAPSYINSPGGWVKDYGLFPYDYVVEIARKKRYVILVEGQRDVLRLLLAGIPALAIMGTQSWSERKTRLLEMLDIDFVILMMDGDDAGIKAVEMIEPQVRKFVNTKVFSLTEKDSPYWPFRNKEEPAKVAKAKGVELWDPQNLPTWKLKELRSHVREWRTEYGSTRT